MCNCGGSAPKLIVNGKVVERQRGQLPGQHDGKPTLERLPMPKPYQPAKA